MNLNFVIGTYWDEEGYEAVVRPFESYGATIFYGTEEEAFEGASLVSTKEGKEYRVFQLVDLGVKKC